MSWLKGVTPFERFRPHLLSLTFSTPDARTKEGADIIHIVISFLMSVIFIYSKILITNIRFSLTPDPN